MIIDGDLRPGSALPERALCDTFGVSRTPLREAFKVLAAEGLIELRPHRTPVITPVDPGEIADMFDVMVGLDGMAGAQAVAKATAGDIARLDEMHHQLVQLHRDSSRAAYFRLNQKIHAEITRLAGNPVLSNIWTTLNAGIFRARALANYDAKRWTGSVEEHPKPSWPSCAPRCTRIRRGAECPHPAHRRDAVARHTEHATRDNISDAAFVHPGLFDGRPRQHGFAGFHHIGVVERVPRRHDVRGGGMRLVVAHEFADQGLGDAELHVAVDMRIRGIVDLRDQHLESRLDDQRM